MLIKPLVPIHSKMTGTNAFIAVLVLHWYRHFIFDGSFSTDSFEDETYCTGTYHFGNTRNQKTIAPLY